MPTKQPDPVSREEIDELLEQFPTHVRLFFGRTEGWVPPMGPADRVSVVFHFSEKGFGFGEITIIQTKFGCFIDTEHMSRETVKRFLGRLVDGAITDTDTEPARHLFYNKFAGRWCGPHCEICYPKEDVLCDRNLDELPADLPDLPECPHCGSAWTDLLSQSVSGEAACVIVRCADGHVVWFGLVRGIPMGWVQLNV